MTSAHIEKFAELLGNDPALSAKLGLDKVNEDAAAAAASAEAFITNAVKEAKHLGLIFTEEELQEFMYDEMEAAASGELSDSQLDQVAGAADKRHFFTLPLVSSRSGNPMKLMNKYDTPKPKVIPKPIVRRKSI